MTQGMTLWQQMGASQNTPFNILLSATTTKPMHKTVTCESHWCLFAWDHKTKSIKSFHLPTLMHNSLFINNMYVTLLSSTCFEH